MTAYEMRSSDWSSDVCASDLHVHEFRQFTFPVAQCSFRTLARGQIENIRDPLPRLPLEAGGPNQYRHTAAILPEKLLFTGLHLACRREFFRLLFGMHFLPFGRIHLEPSKSGLNILPLVLANTATRLIGLDKRSDERRVGNTGDTPVR